MANLTPAASRYLGYVVKHEHKSVGKWVSIKAAEMAGTLPVSDLEALVPVVHAEVLRWSTERLLRITDPTAPNFMKSCPAVIVDGTRKTHAGVERGAHTFEAVLRRALNKRLTSMPA